MEIDAAQLEENITRACESDSVSGIKFTYATVETNLIHTGDASIVQSWSCFLRSKPVALADDSSTRERSL